MIEARRRRGEELFHAALSLDARRRAEFLSAACRDDAELRSEVERLIAAREQCGPFLELPAAHLPIEARAELARQPAIDARIGAWRLERVIASGGMGTVFAARRDDGEYEARVAIKVLNAGLDRTALVRRFHEERQALARLEHPNIARFLDGGVASGDSPYAGLPYMVLEHVDGAPIDEYCARRALGLRERLVVFVDVCSAVQYAHQSLVVHRDLKPSNVLVAEIEGGRPVPKLVDFGISKIVGPAGAARTTLHVLTPQYASPEQVRGEPTGTATDVYSLGMILYELLTGTLPYDVAGKSPTEVERIVCEHAPPPPSAMPGVLERAPARRAPARRAPARRTVVRRALAGDLDNILLKALSKEPERRYRSVAELADDIRRHLDGEPVTARPNTLVYRASKFALRNRVAVLATALVASSIVAGAAISAVGWVRAEREARAARDIAAVLEEIVGSADTQRVGRSLSAAEMLARGERATARLAHAPREEARLLDELARACASLGAFDSAARMYARSLEVRRAHLAGDRAATAATLAGLAGVLLETASPSRPEAIAREALQESGADRAARAAAEHVLGRALARQGRFQAARAALAGAAVDAGACGNSARPFAASIALDRAELEIALGRFDEAETLLERARDDAERTWGPRNAIDARATTLLGSIRLNQNAFDEAECLLRAGLAQSRELLAPDDPAIAVALRNLGRLLSIVGQHAESEPLLSEAVAILRARNEPVKRELALALIAQSNLRTAQCAYDRAEEIAVEALDVLAPLAPEHDREIATLLMGLGILRTVRQHPEEGEPYLREALAMFESLYEAPHERIAHASKSLAETLYQKDPREAEALLLRSLAMYRESRPDEHVGIAAVLNALAKARFALERYDEAEQDYRDACAEMLLVMPAQHPDVLRMRANVAVVRHMRGDAEGAVEILRPLVADAKRALPGTAVASQMRGLLGSALMTLARYDEAEPELREAFLDLRAELGPDAPDVRRVYARLETCYRKANRADSLAALRAQYGLPGDER